MEYGRKRDAATGLKRNLTLPLAHLCAYAHIHTMKTERFTLLLNERLAKAVAQESKKTGASKCEIIRRSITHYLTRYKVS